MKHLIKIVKQISILILTLSLFGCTDEDTKYPEVIAGYTYTINAATGTVTFINISEKATSYVWDFGQEETSTEINPIKTFAPGTYTVSLKAMNVAGGSNTFESEITIEVPTKTCTSELVESYSAASLNMTFKTAPAPASIVADGTSFEWATNPNFEDVLNGSCKVAKIVKLGANPWDNTQFNLDAKLDFVANEGFKIKVYSAKAGFKVRIKLEEIGNPGNSTELEVASTKTSAWEELTFPFATTDTNKFNKIVIFFDLNGNNKDTYYFDDLKLFTRTGGGGGTPPFDDGLLTNGDFQNGSNSWTIGVGTDPAPVKTVSGNTFYSVNVTVAGNAFDVNLSQKLAIVQGSTYTLKFDAWSDRARAIVAGIGLSGGDFSNTTQPVNITTTRTTYTLTLAATNFGAVDARVLFDSGAAIGEVNIDNVSLVLNNGGGGSGGTCPAPPAGDLIPNGNFEAGEGCWELINNGGTATISSTVSSGSGSKSGQIRTAPLRNPAVKQNRFAVGTALPNRMYTVTFDIKANATTPLVDGAVFQAFMFSEGVDGGTTGATQHVLVQGLGSVSTSWETKTYTFRSGAAAANVAGGFSFLAELVCGGAAGCDGIINIDNVSIKLVP
ncbi:carbohydrate binding domain-containing protein [Flavobacterium faecale]|uniref:carbohydrate binding domain-containing protein n=1 Tax=Flavobacterium faecale TaxID=1355330 RepID=UPI003AAB62FD